MQIKTLSLGLVVMLALNPKLSAQHAKQDSPFHAFFVGSTAFVLGNFIPNDPNPPNFVQLNFGYRITSEDVISLELKTWKYAWSLGIPYGDSFQASEEKFPGYIREIGFAIAYQKFFWKGLYAGVHVMNAWQSFVNDNDQKINTGFQIFNTYRLGYNINLFNDRFFLQPSFAITHRPYHTDMPPSFKRLDDKWPNYFIGEPGFHFGFNF